MKTYKMCKKGKKGYERLVGETPTEAFAEKYPNCELVVIPKERRVGADISIELVDGTRESMNYYKVINGAKKVDVPKKVSAPVKKKPVKAVISSPFVTMGEERLHYAPEDEEAKKGLPFVFFLLGVGAISLLLVL